MPDDTDGLNTITYNGVPLGHVQTTGCEQVPEYDASGTDQLYLTTRLRFDAVLSQKVLPVLEGETVEEAARRITHMLSAPRRPLRYARGEEVLIDLPAGRDDANGPLPSGVSVRSFADASWLISWGVEVRLAECPDGADKPDYEGPKGGGRGIGGAGMYGGLVGGGQSDTSGAGGFRSPLDQFASAFGLPPSRPRAKGESRATTRPAFNGVLSNRWSESHDVNPDTWQSTLTRRGTLVVAPAAGVHPDLFRGLVTPPAPPGFRREAHYDLTADGLKLSYSVVDRQLVKPPPAPAVKMTGFCQDTSQTPGVVRRGVLSVTLTGEPGTHPAYLADAAIRLAVGRARRMGLKPTRGANKQDTFIVGGGFREPLDDDQNSVTLDMEFAIQPGAQLPAAPAPAGGPLNGGGGVAGRDAPLGGRPQADDAAINAAVFDAVADVGANLPVFGPGVQGGLQALQGAAAGQFGPEAQVGAGAVMGGLLDAAGALAGIQQAVDDGFGPVGDGTRLIRGRVPKGDGHGPVAAWVGSPLAGVEPGRAVAPPVRGAAGWLTLVAAALKDPCLEAAVDARAGANDVPRVAAATVRFVADLPAYWVETLYADGQQGAYTEFTCRAVYKYKSGMELIPGNGPVNNKTGRPEPHPTFRDHHPTMGVTVELTASKVGGEPDLPAFDGDDNLEFMDASLATESQLLADGVTPEYRYACVIFYKALRPWEVFVKPPVPPFLKPYAKYLMGRSLAKPRTSSGWVNYPEGGPANPFDASVTVTSPGGVGQLIDPLSKAAYTPGPGGSLADGPAATAGSGVTVAGGIGQAIGDAISGLPPYNPNPGG